MWIAVKTDVFSENQSIDFLRREYPSVVKDVYFPLGRRKTVDERGVERVRFVPLLHGLFFVNVDGPHALLPILSPYGYFVYRERKGCEGISGAHAGNIRSAKAHLLCPDVTDIGLDTIIRRAVIPDADMERFIYYNEQFAGSIDGLSIVSRRYDDLVRANDTVRILSGPLEGWVGVVKQVKSGGKKDRHLFVRFGNDYCMSIPDIRQYDMRIEHEATEGEKSEAVGAWRAIDQIIGCLQARRPDEDAPAVLRGLLKAYNAKPLLHRSSDMTDVAYARKAASLETKHKNGILSNVDSSMRGNFRLLAKYFRSDRTTVDKGLDVLVPDQVLRPFLTPASGIEIPYGSDHEVVCHNGMVELVLSVGLGGYFFSGDDYAPDKYAPVFDEDYDYYAHVALLPSSGGKVKAMVSWGAFAERLMSLTADESDRLVADLNAKGYTHTHRLLTTDNPRLERVDLGCPQPAAIGGKAAKPQSISGFSLSLDVAYDADDCVRMGDEAARALAHGGLSGTMHPAFSCIVASAVEIWQGTRFLVWRQLLQRSVLLHKVPVADRESVISDDQSIERAFGSMSGGENGVAELSECLLSVSAEINAMAADGRLMQAACRLLTLTMAFSTHFAREGLYNYIGETFNPDRTLTDSYANLMDQLETSLRTSDSSTFTRLVHAGSHMLKGMAELRDTDSWKYFKFPAFLRDYNALGYRVALWEKQL